MKRSELKRKTQLKRETPLKQRSAKTAKKYATIRVPMVREVLADRPHCEAGPKLKGLDPAWQGCLGYATCLHELKKRAQGGSITDRSNCIPVCGPCNMHIEDEPNIAHKAGLVIKSWENSA